MKKGLISVIIPLYNTEKYIERCVKSIICGTYRDIEVIIVDDGSIDASGKIAGELCKEHGSVRLIRNESNKGLFEARLCGFRAANGEYIAFVDADDYVSPDWFRMLYQTAKEYSADIAIGQFLLDYESGRMSYDNLDPLRQSTVLRGHEVMEAFMRLEGKYYSPQLVWNKLYRRELWEAALPSLEEFSQSHPGLIMCEDIAFSVALWARAKKVANFTHGAFYYYFKHEGQSTAIENNRQKNTGSITGAGAVFEFVEKVLDGFNLLDKYEDDLREWRLDYANLYYSQFAQFNKKYYSELIQKSFNLPSELITRQRPFNAIYSVSTDVDKDVLKWSEQIKERITDENITAVSFDIFDTLIVRPFAKPTDLFKLLNNCFYELFDIHSYYDFKEIRVKSEARARLINATGINKKEEITLDDIYDQIAEDYGFDKERLEALKKKEVELEIKLCYARSFGKQLFELARYMGKRILVTSDMYLSREVVEKILHKNGYSAYDSLYLSQDAGLTKSSANLFRHLIKSEGLKPGEVLHLGDNWESDVVNPVRVGMQSFHLPACTDIFFNRYNGIYGGEAITRARSFSATHDICELENYFIGYSAMCGVIANKLFDCPYVHYNRATDFNCDPFVIGYSALGPYLYAVADWVRGTAMAEGAKRVHFVARDGYLPMLAFDIFKEYINGTPDSSYLYVSRKSMLFSDIHTPLDVYSLSYKINATAYTPIKLLMIFKPFLKREVLGLDDGEILLLAKTEPRLKNTAFKSETHFNICAKELFSLCDKNKIDAHRALLTNYFTGIINEGDLLFDIGYSGRQEISLSHLLGFRLNSLYIHSNSDILNEREKIGGFQTQTFYDKKPRITGVIREHVFMKLAPSTVGYRKSNDTLEPVFETMALDCASEVLTDIMQKAALEFVRDYLSLFGEFPENMYYRKDDFAYLFEYYLHHSKHEDKKVFGGLIFEDELGTGQGLRALDFWQQSCLNIGVNNSELILNTERKSANKSTLLIRLVNIILPYGTKRRELAKRLYHKFTFKL